jgi:hypothetical protein
MSKQYQFDFDKMTIGDLAMLHSDNLAYRLCAVHKITVGGIYHLPERELPNVLRALIDAIKEYEEESANDVSVRDMLDGIEGL